MTISAERDLKRRVSAGLAFLGKKEKELELGKPYGVAVHRRQIYVTDAGFHSAVVINLEKKRFEPLQGAHGMGRMKMPINLAFDRDGNLYVTDTLRYQVLKFDGLGRFIAAFGDGRDGFKPSGIAIAGDRVFVTDLVKHQIVVMDRASGRELKRISSAGPEKGKLLYPTNLALDQEGNIYVSEAFTGRVQKFAPDGKLLRQFGELGNRVGDLVRPKGLALDWKSNLYVVDAASEHAQIWNRHGRLLLFFGGNRGTEDSLYLPAGMCISYDPEFLALLRPLVAAPYKLDYAVLIVNQYGNHKISIFGFLK